jgi:hypothetical protein
VDFIINVTEPSSEYGATVDYNSLGCGLRRGRRNGIERRHQRIDLAVPDACLMMMALPFDSTPALPTDLATLQPGTTRSPRRASGMAVV